MLKITKPLNPFLRGGAYRYVVESKDSITAEGEKKRGAPKMKVHPDMCMITKDLKSDTLPYPEMCMKTSGLTATWVVFRKC